MLEVATKLLAVFIPWVVALPVTYEFPVTASCAEGEVLPIPTRPPLFIRKYVALDEPTANAGPVIPFGFTESCAHGVVEPTPILLVVVSTKSADEPVTMVPVVL